MIKFFRDFLDGPIYFVVAGICVILIMAIIGFIMEKKKLEQEELEKRVVIDDSPIDSVVVREEAINNEIETSNTDSSIETLPNPIVNQGVETNSSDIVQNDDLLQQEQVTQQTKEESIPQPAVQVIDFGSTSSVDIEH